MSASSGPWPIPETWVWTEMGEVANVVGGSTPRTTKPEFWEDGDIPWLTPADLSGYTEMHISRGKRNITRLGLEKSGARMMPAGTVLFTSRAPIGYVAIASNPVATNQGFKSFVLATDLHSGYFYYYLQRAKQLAVELSSGTTFPEISGKKAARIAAPIAPVAEQHRIVEAIETQFTRLDAAVETLKRVQANLKRYRASVLKAAVEGRLVPTEAELARREGRDYEPASVLLGRILEERRRRWEEDELTKLKAKGKEPKNDKWKAKYKEPVGPDTEGLPELPRGWRWATVSALAEVIDPQPSHRTPPRVSGGVPYVGIGDVGPDGRVDLAAARKVSEEVLIEHRARYSLKVGDFVFGKIGTLGAPARLFPPFDYTLSANVVLVQPDEMVNPLFVYYWMQSSTLLSLVRGDARATSQPAFGIRKIRLLPAPLPPLDEQNRIVNQVEDLLSVEKSAAENVNRNLLRLSRFRQSILKWAFEGKLVDQDSSDEPANELLERIRL